MKYAEKNLLIIYSKSISAGFTKDTAEDCVSIEFTEKDYAYMTSTLLFILYKTSILNERVKAESW